MESSIEKRARHAAKRAGLVARKSRWRRGTCDNLGHFMLLNQNNWIVGGQRFDMTAEQVVKLCQTEESNEA
jgi:hypothetical protein